MLWILWNATQNMHAQILRLNFKNVLITFLVHTCIATSYLLIKYLYLYYLHAFLQSIITECLWEWENVNLQDQAFQWNTCHVNVGEAFAVVIILTLHGCYELWTTGCLAWCFSLYWSLLLFYSLLGSMVLDHIAIPGSWSPQKFNSLKMHPRALLNLLPQLNFVSPSKFCHLKHYLPLILKNSKTSNVSTIHKLYVVKWQNTSFVALQNRFFTIFYPLLRPGLENSDPRFILHPLGLAYSDKWPNLHPLRFATILNLPLRII